MPARINKQETAYTIFTKTGYEDTEKKRKVFNEFLETVLKDINEMASLRKKL